MHNLGIVYFKQGHFEEAVTCFAQNNGEAYVSWLYEVIALIEAGQDETAKERLERWTPEMENEVSATEIADIYVQLHEYALAKKWFEFGLTKGYLTPDVISRYTYVLIALKEEVRCQQIIEKQLVLKKEEIQEVQQETCDENWTELDKQKRVEELQAELDILATLFEQLSRGFIPPFDYELYPTSNCYLFGCTQHGHAEYER